MPGWNFLNLVCLKPVSLYILLHLLAAVHSTPVNQVTWHNHKTWCVHMWRCIIVATACSTMTDSLIFLKHSCTYCLETVTLCYCYLMSLIIHSISLYIYSVRMSLHVLLPGRKCQNVSVSQNRHFTALNLYTPWLDACGFHTLPPFLLCRASWNLLQPASVHCSTYASSINTWYFSSVHTIQLYKINSTLQCVTHHFNQQQPEQCTKQCAFHSFSLYSKMVTVAHQMVKPIITLNRHTASSF